MSQESLVARALDLSWRISVHSPPMKPFVRFARETQGLYGDDRRRTRWLFWDFDAMVQKVLLGVVRGTSTPEALAEACKKRWAVNLAQLEVGRRSDLQDVARTGRQVQLPSSPRMKYTTDRMVPNARFLYVGCGAGAECLAFASRGLNVVGIDTVPGLVDGANAWAGHFALPFKAVYADAMTLDPSLGLFDGFFLEFYGDQPSWGRTLRLQANLHSVLTNEGKGFVAATRRKYASYWFLMGTTYSTLMTKRLAVQAHFDYRFSQRDKSEEQLRFGLYTKTHTRESLAAELSHSFDVLECIYKNDPRYVLCVVGRKQGPPAEGEHRGRQDLADTQAVGLRKGTAAVDELLDKVETICEILETHEKKVQEFYDHTGNSEGMSPIKEVEVDYPRFIGLLEEVTAVLPDSEE
jgi:hypothetical protein